MGRRLIGLAVIFTLVMFLIGFLVLGVFGVGVTLYILLEELERLEDHAAMVARDAARAEGQAIILRDRPKAKILDNKTPRHED